MSVTEQSLAEDIGAAFNPQATSQASEDPIQDKFSFDEAFQQKIAALVLRSIGFVRKTEGLISPDHFENQALSYIVNLVLTFYAKYDQTPDKASFVAVLKKELSSNKAIRGELRKDIITTVQRLYGTDLSGADFAADEVAQFANHQDFAKGLIKAMELFDKQDIVGAKEVMDKHGNLGVSEDVDAIDYYADAEKRAQYRKDILAGVIQPSGISTGVSRIDKRLLHKGYGRGEMTIYMGPPKIGKSTALMAASKFASKDGHNVLVISLEVSAEIVAMRIDADLTDMTVDDVNAKPMESLTRLEQIAARGVGKLFIHEYPSSSFTPSQFKRLINRYKSKGIIFDLIALDYLDLMIPDVRTHNPITESKEVYSQMRGITQREGFALVSATQTNREGAKAQVGDMTHVAEDFNRVRIADLVISINKNEEEMTNNEARLYFAASRNQKGNFTVRIKQALDKMRFIESVLGYE